MCTRIMATMGGHVGSLVRKVVVRDTGEDVMVAYHRNLEVTVEAIRGTARMSQYDALQHLVAHGAQLLAHTTPPLVAMHDEARGKGHHDSGTTIAFHEEMRFPVMTSLGNLNVTPDVVDTFLRAAADLTWGGGSSRSKRRRGSRRPAPTRGLWVRRTARDAS